MRWRLGRTPAAARGALHGPRRHVGVLLRGCQERVVRPTAINRTPPQRPAHSQRCCVCLRALHRQGPRGGGAVHQQVPGRQGAWQHGVVHRQRLQGQGCGGGGALQPPPAACGPGTLRSGLSEGGAVPEA
eukprot:CAMPEP_0202874776 /NCGR_PEP_ID=MMETSP1391-20130828/26007_1 /ASSEMBLY_ACC=CAM_ASM_000867 /TAXON_ID=1034604 /ORGANISM="Chlamydomonas leiostraca, Strain SAG 11-49" /LENGTH=129 /DNA_ID=CAMNT_0049556293 /DNA_START=365 /DNA_END=752 /DNA_ORIENTATION=-